MGIGQHDRPVHAVIAVEFSVTALAGNISGDLVNCLLHAAHSGWWTIRVRANESPLPDANPDVLGWLIGGVGDSRRN